MKKKERKKEGNTKYCITEYIRIKQIYADMYKKVF